MAGVLSLALVVPGEIHLTQLLAAAPAIACAGTGRRMCVVLGGICALVALVPLGVDGRLGGATSRAVTVVAILAVISTSYLVTGRRTRLIRELDALRKVAMAAQQVLLRPLPNSLGPFGIVGTYLSASEGAQIGGDLYEVLATPYGVRAILGDVRGHGLAAIGTVAAVLGSFREAAHDEPTLDGLLRRLDRSLHRHLLQRADPGDGSGAPPAEEFVTLVLVELHDGGEAVVVNCGHPPPLRLAPGQRAHTVEAPHAAPPLGLLDLDAEPVTTARAALRPGEALLLHTDGAGDARDADGAFFPLAENVASAVHGATHDGVLDPAAVVATLRDALHRHAGCGLSDDVALLALQRTPAVRADEAAEGKDTKTWRDPAYGG
ncbi:membrane protein [Wenjunlia tyrosinilytica]|uniref:Membrane protein n=1 Tax=Wenjunlia tyrosinilytica TaxID=1544741 RepID=A0A917ZIC7_9ACTN|nr:membrane protein [Wenjunlia tyrosinilytica]